MKENKTILAYKDWLKRNPQYTTLTEGYKAYLEYVNSWYDATYQGTSTAELSLESYKNFLASMTIITGDERVNDYLLSLDYDDANDLRVAIPHFARNLKAIALYIIQKRSAAKGITYDYAHRSSNVGVEMDLYRTALNLFAIKSGLIGKDFLDAVRRFSIEVEEFYDDSEYLDKDPDVSASTYFGDIPSNEVGDTEYLNWLIESGFNDRTSDNDAINPSVSGELPLLGYIDYDTSSDQVEWFKGKLSRQYLGEEHLYLSGGSGPDYWDVYSSAVEPWFNITNKYYPTIANLPLEQLIYTTAEIGGFYIPSKLYLPMALGRNKVGSFGDPPSGGSEDSFPSPSLYSNGYSYTGVYQDSPIVYRSYLNWIDIQMASGRGEGLVGNTRIYQEMVPYKTRYENTGRPFLGMARIGDKTDPWRGNEDTVWEDEENYPPDFRRLYDIDKWYAEHMSLSGVEDQWGVDIYGNNYALYKGVDDSSLHDRGRSNVGVLYVRDVNSVLKEFGDYYEDGLSYEVSGVVGLNVYDDLLVLNIDDGSLVVQQITLDDDAYIASARNATSTKHVVRDVDYTDGGHFYDDRDGTLYVSRYLFEDDTVKFVVYRYDDGHFTTVYRTVDDTAPEQEQFTNTFKFISILPTPTITVSSINDKLYLVYLAFGSEGTYIVSLPLTITGGYERGELVIVKPTTVSTPLGDQYAVERRLLVKSIVSVNNLIIVTEGEATQNRYMQCIIIHNLPEDEVVAPPSYQTPCRCDGVYFE